MLTELRVENLLLIERAELRLAPGLNVLTGETGAGKTVLAHALDLLLGGRARPGIVRPGASEAYVEGVFELDERLRESLDDRVPADASDLVLARRVSADGRTRAYVGGRAATVRDLAAVAGRLISFYGQHEHRRLMIGSAQRAILDDACGPQQAERLADCARAHVEVVRLEARLAELSELDGARERELDLLAYEIAEIEDTDPSEAEEQELLALRGRLRAVDALRTAALTAVEAHGADDGGAAAALAAGAGALDGATGLDPELDALAERWRALAIEASDVAAGLRAYGDDLEPDQGALERAEERLAAFGRLKRKHGGTIATVLAHAERCRVRRGELVDADAARGDAAVLLDEARRRRAAAAAALRAARIAAVPALEAGVRERLAELAMEGASFEIALAPREPGRSGADSVEFLIAPNPGVPATPLRETASGGELSRVMLALLGTAGAGGDGVLVFDEIDAGIGGHTGRAVGEQLRALAGGRQLLCITHLPQVAAHAGRHFAIAKDGSSEPPRTTVTALEGQEVIGELTRMLGGSDDDLAARRHARQLRRQAVA